MQLQAQLQQLKQLQANAPKLQAELDDIRKLVPQTHEVPNFIFQTQQAANQAGVSFLQTPGHTPGSMSMRVDLPETGTMIFTADAVYMGASYGPPTVPAAIVNNLEQFYSSVEKIRGLAEETNATVVFGHDANQIHELRTAPEGSYR